MPNQVLSIQFLRFVAAFMVVVHHAQIALVDQNLAGPAIANASHVTDLGAAGVHVFFVISGFIMVLTTYSADPGRSTAWEFLVRRFLRIYPFYILCCLLYLAIFALIGEPSTLSFSSLMLAFGLTPGYSYLVIGPGWTLAYEIYFYICFAAGLLLAGRNGLILVTLFFLACIAAGSIANFEQEWFRILTNPLLLEFLMGAWIARLVLRPEPVNPRIATPMAAVALVLFFSAIAFDYTKVPTLILWGVPSALLIMALTAKERVDGIPEWMKAFKFSGDASYSLYLLHIIVLDVVLLSVRTLGGGASLGWLWWAIGVLVSIAVSFAAHAYLEKPLQQLLKNRVLPAVGQLSWGARTSQ